MSSLSSIMSSLTTEQQKVITNAIDTSRTEVTDVLRALVPDHQEVHNRISDIYTAVSWKRLASESATSEPLVVAATFTSHQRGSYGGLSGAEANGILELEDDVPLSVHNCLQALCAPRPLSNSSPSFAQSYVSQQFPSRFQLVSDPTVDGGAGEQPAPAQEIAHYIMAIDNLCKTSMDMFRAAKAQHFVKEYLTSVCEELRRCRRDLRLNVANFPAGKDWPFPIFAKVGNIKYSTIPQSDFQIRINNFPHCIVEVCSNPNHEEDLYRMHIQAGILVRLANVVSAHKPTTFILLGLYLTNDRNVLRYLFFMDNGGNVRFVVKQFDLKDRHASLEFLIELYNFRALMTENLKVLGWGEGATQQLSQHAKGLDTFSAKRSRTSGGPKSSNKGGTSAPPGPGGASTLPAEVRDALLMHDLQFESPVYRSVFEVSRKDGRRSIVKIIRDDQSTSLESTIHSFLNEINDIKNHTMPLQDSFTVLTYSTLIMPIGIPLLQYDIEAQSDLLSRQLLVGVGFMHQHGVAHLDLKPANLVVLDGDLRIIDYGLSQKVVGRDTLLTGFRGTEPWVAPEVGTEDGPAQTFSAIAADLWATGRLIIHTFSPHLRGAGGVWLCSIAHQLMNDVPNLRPSIDDNLLLAGPTALKNRIVERRVVEDDKVGLQKREMHESRELDRLTFCPPSHAGLVTVS